MPHRCRIWPGLAPEGGWPNSSETALLPRTGRGRRALPGPATDRHSRCGRRFTRPHQRPGFRALTLPICYLCRMSGRLCAAKSLMFWSGRGDSNPRPQPWHLADAEAGRLLTRSKAPKKASTLAVDKGRIERHIKPLLGRLAVAAVTREDIERFLHDVAEGRTAGETKTAKKRGLARVTGGRTAATRAVGLLGGIFTYAVRRSMRADNPAHGNTRSVPMRGRPFNRSQAACGSGRMLRPVLVSASLAVRRARSSSAHRKPNASPVRQPVRARKRAAAIAAGHISAASALRRASPSAAYSSSDNRRSRCWSAKRSTPSLPRGRKDDPALQEILVAHRQAWRTAGRCYPTRVTALVYVARRGSRL